MGTSSSVAVLDLKVVPGGSRDTVAGRYGDRVRVKVSAPPEGGKANRAVLDLLARRLHLPVSAFRIVRGETLPLKTVAVTGISTEAALAALLAEEPRR